MGHRFAELMFTDSVREVQEALGSRAGYGDMEGGDDFNHILGEHEAAFIGARDSFYMASVSETGWPYIQHRGGPAGFVRVIDERTIGFADFRGNRQYVSVGNLRRDDRVALFFMDYLGRSRLKLLGRVKLVDDPALLAKLEVAHYRARVERGFLIHVEAFDWNCPQHITPRYTESEVRELMAPLIEENRALEARQGSRVPRSQVLGRGPLELVISGIRQLTPRVRAFELRSSTGGPLPAFDAGAHIQVPVRLTDGGTAVRQYSICSDPARRDAYEIAVLREDSGAGGSRAVHESFDIGARLQCGLPQNHFPLHADARSAVLIAGGIGVTPIKAMAHVLKRRGTFFELHYASRSAQEASFLDELVREFGENLRIYLSVEGRRAGIREILSSARSDAVFYVCGPERLIVAAQRDGAALRIDGNRIRIERFTVDAPAQAGTPAPSQRD